VTQKQGVANYTVRITPTGSMEIEIRGALQDEAPSSSPPDSDPLKL
jgi:hypothetical protein